MTSRLYRAFMRHSSVILFVLFALSFMAVFAGAFSGYLAGQSAMEEFPMEGGWAIVLSSLLGSFRQAFEYTAMLLFASALLFRADKWLEAKE
jgi:hypothetical protein